MPLTLSISQLAQSAAVPVSTIRYYERRGLLRPRSRSRGNYRVYDDDSLSQLRLIRSAQAAGFTLADIKVLLRLRTGPSAPCREIQSLITERLGHLREQAAHLDEVQQMLRQWLRVCRAAAKSDRCGVLAGLSGTDATNSGKSCDCP